MSRNPPRPTRLLPFPNGEIGISWDDGRSTYISARRLRCACPCAHCVDERTGRKILNDEDVPADVQMRSAHPVGNYGIAIVWTDGHETGIYPIDRLLEMTAQSA